MSKHISTIGAKLSHFTKWARLFVLTGGAQIAIQALGFVSGILIIRVLSTEQYAYYTLLNAMLGTMTNLADGGIVTGVIAHGGKVWKDRLALSTILATGMALRRRFAIFSLLVTLPILFYLLHSRGVVWWEALLLMLSVAPAFWAGLSGSLLESVPKLHQEVRELLKIKVSINLLRLLITVPVVLLFPFAGAAILAAGSSQVVGNFRLRKLSKNNSDYSVSPDHASRKLILSTVRRTLPGVIYYCISGQITIWLVALFNSTDSLAQVGALSKLVMPIILIKSVVDMVILPRFARLAPETTVVRTRLYQIIALLIAVSLCGSYLVYLFPEVGLWVLGEKYYGLEYELVLMVVSGCFSMLSGVMYSLTSSRDIIPNPYLVIAFTIGTQALLLAYFVDFTQLSGVLWFSIGSAASIFVYRLLHFTAYTFLKANRAR